MPMDNRFQVVIDGVEEEVRALAARLKAVGHRVQEQDGEWVLTSATLDAAPDAVAVWRAAQELIEEFGGSRVSVVSVSEPVPSEQGGGHVTFSPFESRYFPPLGNQ